MSSEEIKVLRVERVDDIPVLWGCLQQLGVSEHLDRYYPSHHLWAGELTFGEVVCVWLTFLLSQGDHRLYRLQGWAEDHLLTLQSLLGKTVRPLDFHDDRLADILSQLPQAESWLDFENDLNQHTIRVYDLSTSRFRLDTTTVNSHAAVLSEHGLIQFGFSKDDPDRPQLKVALSTLDPLGMPTATLVVPGNCSDDPLYLPLIQQNQQAFGKGGKTYVSDVKGAALATRAYLVNSNDYYLCPLSEKQVSKEQRRAWAHQVHQGQQTVQEVYRPKKDPEEEEELLARGFDVEVELQAEVAGKSLIWKERRWVVQSVAYAEGQAQKLQQRLQQAEEELGQLAVRKQGKAVLSALQMEQAAEAILKKQRVEGLLKVTVQTTRQERTLRRYRDRPEQVVVEESHRVEVKRQEEALALAEAELGWQVYGVNDLELSLEGVVWAYRGQYQVEKGFSRLKGCPLSLSPMYLADEERMLGLVLLLSLALRVLTVLQWQVRRQLQQSGEVLRGLYPGQPGRKTSSPSAELLLYAFKGISLTLLEVAGQHFVSITSLTPLQQKLLALWHFPADLYQRLAALHSPEPPPALSER